MSSALSGQAGAVISARRSSAAKLCSARCGGELRQFYNCQNESELRTLLAELSQRGEKPLFLGYGSNLLVDERGLETPVIKLSGDFKSLAVTTRELKVGAGSSVMQLARSAAELGLSGLEFAGGIPGSLGGALKMNAGAHGGEFSELVKSVQGFTGSGEYVELPASELSFSYRFSSFPRDFLICSALLRLSESSKDRVLKRTNENLEYRKATQPLTLPSFGSVFTNPKQGSSAGALIEACGLKGFKHGAAEVSALHANWIVNPTKKARSSEVLQLIELIQERVFTEKGLRLNPEVVIWSDEANKTTNSP